MELYCIYADEGTSGTSTKKRTQFNKMIQDALSGKFQLILTKEVSRFSRNILDTIGYTRQLKSLGIGVVFLNDGINTLDPDAELRLSIMGSIAQEESRRTSFRVKWGQTRQMEKGVVFGRSLLGYDVACGKIEPEPYGAEIVRYIFGSYCSGKKSAKNIADDLKSRGIKTFSGGDTWSPGQIIKILKNEKYAGDLVQKKTFTPDYLTHEKKYNHGQEQLVIIKDHHIPIVSRDMWNRAQDIMARRSRKRGAPTFCGTGVFSGKIKCGECGKNFVSRLKYRKDGTFYRCWGCSSAVRYGSKKSSPDGCDVGIMLRSALCGEIMNEIICSFLKEDYIERLLRLVSESYKLSGGSAADKNEICCSLMAELTRNQEKNIIYGMILEQMTVYKNRHIEVKLKHLPYIWRFTVL